MADGGHLGDREHFWRDHVAGWKSSGLSLRLYSERHGLKTGTLGYWNSRLKAQAADAPASSAGPEAAVMFLAVHVADPAVSVPEPRNAHSTESYSQYDSVGRDVSAQIGSSGRLPQHRDVSRHYLRLSIEVYSSII